MGLLRPASLQGKPHCTLSHVQCHTHIATSFSRKIQFGSWSSCSYRSVPCSYALRTRANFPFAISLYFLLPIYAQLSIFSKKLSRVMLLEQTIVFGFCPLWISVYFGLRWNFLTLPTHAWKLLFATARRLVFCPIHRSLLGIHPFRDFTLPRLVLRCGQWGGLQGGGATLPLVPRSNCSETSSSYTHVY